ncbi:MAG: SET domain-containing protein-lysine N-methyltransferase [Candidatus Omnitrophica bacterium]|nr:SET domain-containing protein-lysine N-methyltransferase [Candidatus Omnitrophota bacterium]
MIKRKSAQPSNKKNEPLVSLTLKKSSIHNVGLYANEDIAKGTKIIEYVGEKITAKEAGRRVDASLENHRSNHTHGAVYIFELNNRYSIDGDVPYNTARHINHSCDPNAETDIIRGKVWIIAIRDIKAGEEILYNYGYEFKEDYKDHPCLCGSSRCVGFIIHEDSWPQLRRALKKESRTSLTPRSK